MRYILAVVLATIAASVILIGLGSVGGLEILTVFGGTFAVVWYFVVRRRN